MQARDTKELNVLEAKAPSILETQLNNKEESEDEYRKLEDILEEEILDMQPKSIHEVLDLEDTKEEEDNKDKDNLLEKRIYQIIMKMENELLKIKESYRRIQQKIALKGRNIGLTTHSKHLEISWLYYAQGQCQVHIEEKKQFNIFLQGPREIYWPKVIRNLDIDQIERVIGLDYTNIIVEQYWKHPLNLSSFQTKGRQEA